MHLLTSSKFPSFSKSKFIIMVLCLMKSNGTCGNDILCSSRIPAFFLSPCPSHNCIVTVLVNVQHTNLDELASHIKELNAVMRFTIP